MRYLALACDYDGTLAHHGAVAPATIDALERIRDSGRRLLMVTGREIDDLKLVFRRLDLFDCIVAENGALLYEPNSEQEQILAEPPPEAFVEALRRNGVSPISTGRVIVATWEPHEHAVLETIRDMGLELHVIFNKGAVMVLPSNVSKATGLAAAAETLGLSLHNIVGMGDAENDHAFLAACECGVAVANALPMLKERADLVTTAPHGEGVAEVIEQLLADDLARLEPGFRRHHILLGVRAARTPGGEETEVRIPPYGTTLLIAGSSGAGKTTVATAFLERLMKRAYQCCVIDPEGDYGTVENTVAIGTPHRPPDQDEVIEILQGAAGGGRSAVVNLVGERFEDRPSTFGKLLGRLLDLRSRTGRPHWLLVDEAHHVAPSSQATGAPGAALAAERLGGLILITVEPRTVARPLVAAANIIVTVGDAAAETMRQYAEILGLPVPPLPDEPPPRGHVLVWDRRSGEPPFEMRIVPGTTDRKRHVRKYAQGELPPDRSFYFRGPESRLNLRAQNLITFLQLADGIDDQTWMYHLRRGDYSQWFRSEIKDDRLADDAARVEKMEGIPGRESRAMIRAAIAQRYTMPAT